MSLCRTDLVEVVQTYQHVDSDDVFEREPFCIMFRTKEGSQSESAVVHEYSLALLLHNLWPY